ncbi:MAG TPA: prolyl oligopeptidase family serine peptidase [Chloroflexota bacterium]|nr:prolyl oligopeptidase family serine peptidase [Chloroflexota bacterium]
MFQFFPGNYMWSQATLRALAAGGTVGEVVRVVATLQDAARDYDYDAWYRAWRALGDHLWQQGEWELAADHPRSARESFLRACNYYQWAIAFLEHTDPRKRESHQRSVEAFAHYARLAEPPLERVEVPYEGTSFPAWFVPGAGAAARKPTVIYLPGLDSTKEQGLPFAQVLAARGFNTLLPDGPGIGEAVLFRGLINRHDYEVPGKAAFDYLTTRADVDTSRIATVGVSMGGYRAPRFAAFEPRLAGCVAWGAIWDWAAVWAQRISNERGAVPTPHSHVLFVMGAKTLDEVTEKVQAWRLAGVASQIRCPLLITHGERDAQIPVEQAYALYEAAGSPQKELKIFTEAEGGSAHCQNDNRVLAHNYIADWLEDVLVRGRRREGVIVGWERKA